MCPPPGLLNGTYLNTSYNDTGSGSWAHGSHHELVGTSSTAEWLRRNLNYYIYNAVVAAVALWCVLYCIPSVITTTTVGNRKLAASISELYRVYLYTMSTAGFLTVLTHLVKPLFCVESELYGNHSMTSDSIQCYSDEHLRMLTTALICLAIFFPSASLTVLFRYNDHGSDPFGGEDIRYIHYWRRAEYMVKGVFVYTSHCFIRYGRFALVAILCGSGTLSLMNYYMQPCALNFVNRWKLLIHLCSMWTSVTCIVVITVDNKNGKPEPPRP